MVEKCIFNEVYLLEDVLKVLLPFFQCKCILPLQLFCATRCMHPFLGLYPVCVCVYYVLMALSSFSPPKWAALNELDSGFHFFLSISLPMSMSILLCLPISGKENFASLFIQSKPLKPTHRLICPICQGQLHVNVNRIHRINRHIAKNVTFPMTNLMWVWLKFIG